MTGGSDSVLAFRRTVSGTHGVAGNTPSTHDATARHGYGTDVVAAIQASYILE